MTIEKKGGGRRAGSSNGHTTSHDYLKGKGRRGEQESVNRALKQQKRERGGGC